MVDLTMVDQTIKVGKSFTQIQVAQGEFTLFLSNLNQNSQYFTVSRSVNGDNALVCDSHYSFSGPATIYVKGTNDESFVVLSDDEVTMLQKIEARNIGLQELNPSG